MIDIKKLLAKILTWMHDPHVKGNMTVDGSATVSGGNITTKINWDGTTTGSNTWRSFLANDKETTPVTVGQFTTGRGTTYTQAFIQTRNPKLSSGNTNALGVTVNDNGTLGYTISSPGAFRSALGISDYVTSSGSGTASNATWTWRKWASGKIEAWCSYAPSSAVATTVWVSPIRYKDLTISIPSGVFSSAPARVYGTSYNNQLWVVHAIGASATSITCRIATLSSNNVTTNVRFYCTN